MCNEHIASLVLLPVILAISTILSAPIPAASLVFISFRQLTTSSVDGKGTLTPRHLDLIGNIILLKALQTSIILQFALYFSIVLRRAAWASLVSLSASVMTIVWKLFPLALITLLLAVSLITFCIICLSLLPLSAGHISFY